MKKIIIALLFVLGIGHGLRAQAVVHDPVHMGANIVGFSESVGQAIETTGNLLSLLGMAEDQLEKLEKTIEYVEKVTLAARTIQSVGYSIQEMGDVLTGIDASIKNLRYAVSQKNMSIQEATNILNAYSGVMNSLTNVGNAIMSVTTSGMEQMNQWQRAEMLGRLGDSIHLCRNKVERLNNGINDRMIWRETLQTKRDSMNQLSAMSLAATTNSSDFLSVENLENGVPVVVPPQVTAGALNDAFKTMAVEGSKGVSGSGSKGGWGMNTGTVIKTSSQVNTELSKEAKGWAGLFYVISGLVGLIGAVQIYRKYQFGGEDLAKNIATWAGTTLLLFVIGLIFNFNA